jgi:hypothetical protein
LSLSHGAIANHLLIVTRLATGTCGGKDRHRT